MSGALTRRDWLPPQVQDRIEQARGLAAGAPAEILAGLEELVAENHRIHDVECLNLNPATNVMNPRAEALLSRGLGTRASLGYPGDKYEVGLEAIEQIEVVAAELAARVFGATYAEVRVGSGALANLYAFMATTRPGQRIIAPPATIGGHVTHHVGGAAGWYGLETLEAPVDPRSYSIDVDALRALARETRPALITVGGSLNLQPHPVADLRAVADEVGALLLFDAAHLCGVIAGGAWPNPLEQGAHLMTMSTYKSLGGPPGGLVVTRDAELAQRLEAIAYPGLTANSDAGRVAALAVTLVDWTAAGMSYAEEMVASAAALAAALQSRSVPVFSTSAGPTSSHQIAIEAAAYGGGQHAARALRRTANLLTCGIGLPLAPIANDLNGLRIGTPEAVRLGMTTADMPQLAELIARGLDGDATVAAEVTEWRSAFTDVHYTADPAASAPQFRKI
ncbi:serine hydroxymethyltransferase [Cumulibacter manganitolerans]|uniref:serine hydroxymethyltransferase n=1 Tax=Cumulibacter manganitolerans TaxID=1884992 RepID=UPI001294DD63|nr:aminotransferase class I/II-fold pyridoxal phosphate-dependent enzyme [Cumulibacter manganitolerans]